VTNVDDLARLLVPPPGEDVIIRDARILRWNPTTFENVIEYEGIRLENVDVGAGAAIEALTYQPGDLVQLELRFTGGKKGELGIGDVAIRGRRITPGTGAAEKAVAFMQSSLAKSLSAQIFAERLLISTTTDPAIFTSGTGGHVEHPEGASAAARITGVQISETGRAWVVLGTTMAWTSDGNGAVAGFVGTLITGATTVEPFGQQRGGAGAGGPAPNGNWAGANSHVFEGLNPGVHTFEARYTVNMLATNASVTFGTTTLIVVPF